LFNEKNAYATLCGRYNYENISKWIKKAPGNKIFNLKNNYFIINIDNNHRVYIVVNMEEKRIQYYNSLNGVGKGHKYLKGTLLYLYDLDEKKDT
jgi:Ulp1 family protease